MTMSPFWEESLTCTVPPTDRQPELNAGVELHRHRVVVIIIMVAVNLPLKVPLGETRVLLRVLGPTAADKRDIYILYIYIY